MVSGLLKNYIYLILNIYNTIDFKEGGNVNDI